MIKEDVIIRGLASIRCLIRLLADKDVINEEDVININYQIRPESLTVAEIKKEFVGKGCNQGKSDRNKNNGTQS